MKGTGNSVEWFGVDQVLSGYDLHCRNRDNKVYYSIWQAGLPKFVYDGGEQAEGRELLEENLQAWKVNGNTAMYTLRFHPCLDKNEQITNNSPVNGSGNFKINDSSFVSGVSKNDSKLDILIEMFKKQEERLTALEEGEFEEEIEEVQQEPTETENIIGSIKRIEESIITSPLLSGLYTDARLLFRGLAKKWGVDMSTPKTEQAMNGTNTQQPKTDMATVMKELVQAFPELPNLLIRLHQILHEDRDTFDLAKKKLIDGINKL